MAGRLTPLFPTKQGIRICDLSGRALFTLVVPDNQVVSRVLQSDWFTQRLFTPWKHYPELKQRRVQPVTVLSHPDIGTY